MKKLNVIILLIAAMVASACVSREGKYNYQIPEALVIDADTSKTIPPFIKEIGETKVICYLVDSCSRNYEHKAWFASDEIGNTIGCLNDVFGTKFLDIENDSFSITIPELRGTSLIVCDIQFTDTTYCFFRAIIEPNKVNRIWVDLTKPHGEYYNIYSDNIYNALNNKLGKFDDNNSLKPEWVDLYDISVIRYSEVVDSINESSDAYPLAQLTKICCEFEQKMWKDAPEDAANFIGDDFCIAAYKKYREQCIEAYKRAEGVFAKETPNVADEELFSAMIKEHIGKPIVVDFWGTYCGPCMMDLRMCEPTKGADTTYVYISSSQWSPLYEWNKTINNVKGYHYYIPNESFDLLLRSFGNKFGFIPFKLYVDENGKTYSYEDRTPLDPEAKENKRPVYIEEVPNVPNDSLISAIVEKHKGKPTIIDFWGVHCIPCMKEISIKEKTKTDDVNYIYITCTANSPQNEWEETIKDISGYHYYISDEAFFYILEQHKTTSIPFKLYFSKDGVLEKTQVGAEY